MKSKFKIEAAIRAVLTAKTDNFVELVKLARLAPESEFRNTDLSGCDFSGCDLTEFDFSGSNLEGANLKGATINGAPLHNGAEAPQVTAFVSYATADARSESALVSPLIREVRNAVNSRLRSYRFALLNEQVSSAREKISLQGSLDVGILIVLLSPAWILSAPCKDEYLSFIERYGDLGKDRIVPIKIARLGEYVERLDERQVRLWAELNANPNCVWLPIEFTQATRIQKKSLCLLQNGWPASSKARRRSCWSLRNKTKLQKVFEEEKPRES